MRLYAGFRRRRATTAVLVVALVAAITGAPGITGRADRADAVQSPTTCTTQSALTNGSFESPSIADGTSARVPATEVPGWGGTDATIGVFASGAEGITAPAGRQFVEVSSTVNGSLFQDVRTTPGQTLSWSVRHRGHRGTETMRVLIGAPDGTLTQSGGNITDGTAAWRTSTGTYRVPAGQTTTRIWFRTLPTAGGSVGNLIDDVAFGSSACVIVGKTAVDLTRATGTAQVGDVLRYSLSASNGGGSPATASVLTDALPAGLEFVPGSLRVADGPGAGAITDRASDDRGEFAAASRTVTVRLGDGATATAGGSLSPGAATTVTFDVRVTVAAAAGSVANTGRVSYADALLAGVQTSTSPTVQTPVAAAADVGIATSIDTNPLVAGAPVRIGLVASNAGPQAATGVVVSYPIPAGVTGVAATGPGATCAVAAGSLRCTMASLAAGGTATIAVTGTLDAGLAPGTAVTGTAGIAGALTDQNPANNTATAAAIVTTSADLRVAKTFTPLAPRAGADVTYQLTATNAGPSDATGVTVHDPLDPRVTFVSATSGCSLTAGVVDCPVGVLRAGASASATITVHLPPNAAGAGVQNGASVDSATSDPNAANDVASTSFEPTATADLSISASAQPATVSAGETVRFTLAVHNAGPSDAADAALEGALPAGLVARSITAPPGATCDGVGSATVACDWTVIPAGGDAVVTVVAELQPDAPDTRLTTTATVSAPAADADTTNNSATASVLVSSTADLATSMSATPATGVPGTRQAFTITVRNSGPAVSRGVRVHDVLPSELDGASTPTPGCTVSSGEFDCLLGDLAVGASTTVTVQGTVRASALGEITDSATAASATPDPQTANDSADVAVPLIPAADLSVTKTTSTPRVAAGGQARFAVVVRNDGPSWADAVSVLEEPDPALGLTSATPDTGTWSTDDDTWSVGALAPGAVATLQVTALALVDGTASNAVTASSPTPDPDAADLVARAPVVITPSADLAIAKSVDVDPLPQNGRASYTISVTNAGPSTAAGITVSDDLPAGLADAETSSAGCTVVGASLRCTVASLAAGAAASVVVSALVDPTAVPEAITNTATVAATTDDPDPSDNSASISTPVATGPAVALEKTAAAPRDLDGDGMIGAGDGVDYAFSVRDTGTGTLGSVTIDDPPLGGALDCPALSGRTLRPNDVVACGPILHHLSQAEVDAGVAENSATVRAVAPGSPDPVTASATASVAVQGTPALSLAIIPRAAVDADGDGSIAAGDSIPYDLVLRNTGTLTLRAADADAARLGADVSCPPDPIAPGGIAVCTGGSAVITQADADAGQIVVDADASALDPHNDPADASASVTTALDDRGSLALTKTAGAYTDANHDDRIDRGDTLDYRFVVTNTGPLTLTAVTIDDPNLGGVVNCGIGALAPRASAECSASYTLTEADARAGSVLNAATASARAAGGAVEAAASVRTDLETLAMTGAALGALPWGIASLLIGLLISLVGLAVAARRRRSAS